GQLVVLTNGNLATAMRASMAVPGAFTPVLIDGKLLIDGGIVDNLPVDVVRAMGADIVIAVDVGKLASEATTKWKYESVTEILSRTYEIIRRPDQDRMALTADILIAPDVSMFGASDFQGAASIIPAGVPAANAVSNQLKALVVDTETYQAYLDRQRRKNTQSMILKSVKVMGNQLVSTPVILAQIHVHTNEPVQVKSIETDMARIYGLGDFQNVTYELQPEAGGDELIIHAQEKYWGPGYLRFGLRLESDFDHGATWGALLNYSRRRLNALGGEIQLDLKGGSDQEINLEWFQPLNYSSTLFIAPALNSQSTMISFYSNDYRIAQYERKDRNVELDIGSQLTDWGEIRAGLYYGNLEVNRKTGSSDLPNAEETIAAWTTRFTLDRLDDPVFSTKGFYLTLEGFFADEHLGGDRTYSKLMSQGSIVKTLGRHTLSAGGSVGHSLGSDVPLYDQFHLGGFGTLPGLNPGQLRGPYFALGNIGYRYKWGTLPPSLGDGVYYLLRWSAGNAWKNSSDIKLDDLVTSIATGLGADTALGPMLVAVGLAERETLSYFFSVGTVF
ncbi:MAG: BamA/TamA family outer membrane protein, partial [Lentisphaerota bacterium]